VAAVAAAAAVSRTRKTRVALALLIALSWSAPLHLHGVGDLGREVLANDDGWAAFGAGTTGGAAATPDNVFVATNRQELIAALNNGVYPPPSIDHNDFADVETADETLPVYFGRPFQVHDGHVDITNASNYVTVSWNRLRDHDKVMLIGSSDSAAADRGKLKVTLHHNLFENVGQRAPRVRFGQVHVYNNYYRNDGFAGYVYSWGVGVESQIYAENNFFRTFRDITPDRFIARFNGTAVVTLHTSVDAASENHVVDVRAEYNFANDPDLAGAVGWVPVLHRAIDQSHRVPGLVESGAGPMNW